ncbi:peptide-methionine (S)-S-oxide reductase MsrA [Nesterenkonia cremea]|uniref:Peptide methionine sulfoxide reductase MsrA n=1 Tax=Nesterenkonia cremea TaxID=1882340 RepID=A0A917AV15_9MICC|nr:peptide-methionine (S)-S-oxide reductase MsrA [Nesterenkonia cremea]GGE72761.1 peptide methionine sulfoxide reductase MsrA [Nesterenkonia cremea]
MTDTAEATTRTVVLAAGCFWCLDSLARRLQGVEQVRSLYTGGTAETANYSAVCTGMTAHAEAVEITYDPTQLPTEVLLEVFFTSHDPTSLNRQGHDVGPQYRSAMFYSTDQEKAEWQEAITRFQQHYDRPIVTTLEPLEAAYEAEPEHQNFHARRPEVGYCQFIIDPKVARLRRHWGRWMRPIG